MSYPLEDENAQAIIDLMEPRERLIFDLCERQMELSRLHLRVYRASVLWGVITGFCLVVVAACLAVTMFCR